MTFKVGYWAATTAVVWVGEMVCRAGFIVGRWLAGGVESDWPLGLASTVGIWVTAQAGFGSCSWVCTGEDVLAGRSNCRKRSYRELAILIDNSEEWDRNIPETLIRLTSTVAQITISQMFHVRSGDVPSNTLAATITLIAAAQMLHLLATTSIGSIVTSLTKSQK